MTAIESGAYQDALRAFGASCRPQAILVLSAHWESGDALSVTSAVEHKLVYDFGGFPPELYAVRYPVKGDPGLAGRVRKLLGAGGFVVAEDSSRGLDHGVWSPLVATYPAADVPVVELSLPSSLSPAELFRMGGLLRELRAEGVMILGSGGIVHNLRRLDWTARDGSAAAWAKTFDDWFAGCLEAGDVDSILRYTELGPSAREAVPTPEHFLPVFPVLGGGGAGGRVTTIHAGFEYATISMRCFRID